MSFVTSKVWKAHRFAPVPKKSQLSCLINITSEQVYLTGEKSRGRKKTNLLQAWWIQFGKARQHLLTLKHMSSTIDFFGKTGMIMSRFAGGLCFGLELQVAFSASFVFAYLLKRTRSKSVLAGSESFDDSELQSITVLLRPWKNTHTGASEGGTSSIQIPVLRLKEIFILGAIEQSDGSRSCVSWMLKLLSRSDEYPDRRFREDRVAWAPSL